ncbi:GTP 3',8-cyclase MoaA [Sedimentitalea nanhaiensis]|uniref:GTP 3',8-cyclase n=1 Tax=Sedimentitalea nanhaiensis TaxID=999627 RepID=A0A1I7EC14_9RHOB|nr:GTP 3',8-cyclase MoaA [Sedimentitalea nanhaiensis]SFU21393.1 cyclic pyranopterin monophosphate synthase subunit MoaA [Sedimentitalea nanhaiensis]
MPLDVARLRPLSDSFGRSVTYLRLSLTDRCDLRCTYCMAENMVFMPKRNLLSIAELARLSDVFIRRGVRKLRLTGGEPLVRKGVMDLIAELSRHLETGALEELTLTTNGTQLARYADDLAKYGVRRVNVSLDTLDPAHYRKITRRGDLEKVLNGLDAAQTAGLKVKLNAIASRGAFESELDSLIHFAHGRSMDLTLIEEMPMGATGQNRAETFLPLDELRAGLARRWTLAPLAHATGGPARYLSVAETGGRLGFISPMSCNFCALCNRVRLSAAGRLFTCMGQEGSVDLRPALEQDEDVLDALLRRAVSAKPQGHDFGAHNISHLSIRRFMSALGG